MPELKATTKYGRKSSHYHIVYLDYETQEGYISPGSSDDKRSQLPHRVIFNPPQEALLDPATGAELAPATPASFVIEPAEDGHTHEIVDYEISQPFPEEEDSDVVREMVRQFKQCLENEQESIDEGTESWDFYFGKQWKDEDKRQLESQNRAALTINDIARYVDELSGYQRQQRTMLTFRPYEGGDQRVADILKYVSFTILNNCMYHREKSRVFMDQIIPGRGVWNIYLSRDRDLQGDLIVERFPWDSVVFGAHEKEDGSDAELVFKHKMYSLGKLKQLFGDKADDIQRDFEMYSSKGVYHLDIRDDAYKQPDNVYGVMPDSLGDFKMVDTVKKQYRLLERQQKVYIPTAVVAQPLKNWYFTAYGWKKSDLALVRKMGFLGVIDFTLTKIRITKIVGNTVLSDENPADLPIDDFLVIPVYGKKYENKFRGKVHDAKDAQRQVNYRVSQSIDIGNKMCAYGWFYDDDMFPDEKERQKFINNASTPGFTIRLVDAQQQPQKVEGTKFPAELVNLMELSSAKVGEMMNITPTAAGANTSGEAYLQQQKIRLTGNEYLFDNLKFADQKLGRLLIAFIRRYYSPTRILRILQDQHTPADPVKLGGREFDSYTPEEITQLLQEDDLTRYDIAVGESAESPTARLATQALLRDLGDVVPPELTIAVADIPEETRTKILDGITQAQQSQASAAAEAADGEINKTLIAQGIIPPSIQAKLKREQAELQQPPNGQAEQPMNGAAPAPLT